MIYDKRPSGRFFYAHKEVMYLDNHELYVDLLKKALAAETETVRLYTAILALAPEKHVPKLLELNADETDHQAIIADMLTEAMVGVSADQQSLVPGVS